MIVFRRSKGQEIVINGNVRVKICAVNGRYVKVSVDAPKSVTVHRGEVQQQIDEGR